MSTTLERYLRQVPDPRPGNYYVSVADAGRVILALGPFDTHQEAMDHVQSVNAYVSEKDPCGHFYAYGTARTESDSPRPGKLNSVLIP